MSKNMAKQGNNVSKLEAKEEQKSKSKTVEIVSLTKLIPNMLTVMALCAGLTSLRFALTEKWELAVIAILIAAIFDALDGAMARLLKATSKLGAELDSLSDFLSFGIAPSLIVYLWLTNEAKGFGWFAALVFAVSTALRLARFNVETKKENETDKNKIYSHYFQGVPSPAGAFLALCPIIVYNYFDHGFLPQFEWASYVISAWVFIIALLMVSKVPTFSLKKMKIPKKLTIPLLGGLGLLVAALITEPWLTLSFVAIVYMVSIIFSVRSYRKYKLKSQEEFDFF